MTTNKFFYIYIIFDNLLYFIVSFKSKNTVINEHIVDINNINLYKIVYDIMSISLESWESIFHIASKFFNENLPLYFSNDYIEIIENVIVQVVDIEDGVQFCPTHVVLSEPLISSLDLKIIFLSVPLFADLINERIDIIHTKIKPEKSFNLSSVLSTITYKNNDYSCINDETKKLDSNKQVIFIILIRIVLIVQHWRTHIKTNTMEDLKHEEFECIEMAIRENETSFGKK